MFKEESKEDKMEDISGEDIEGTNNTSHCCVCVCVRVDMSTGSFIIELMEDTGVKVKEEITTKED